MNINSVSSHPPAPGPLVAASSKKFTEDQMEKFVSDRELEIVAEKNALAKMRNQEKLEKTKKKIEKYLFIRWVNFKLWLGPCFGKCNRDRHDLDDLDLTKFPLYVDTEDPLETKIRKVNEGIDEDKNYFFRPGEHNTLRLKILCSEDADKDAVFLLKIPFTPAEYSEDFEARSCEKLAKMVDLICREILALGEGKKAEEISRKEVKRRVRLLIGINKPYSMSMEENAAFSNWIEKIQRFQLIQAQIEKDGKTKLSREDKDIYEKYRVLNGIDHRIVGFLWKQPTKQPTFTNESEVRKKLKQIEEAPKLSELILPARIAYSVLQNVYAYHAKEAQQAEWKKLRIVFKRKLSEAQIKRIQEEAKFKSEEDVKKLFREFVPFQLIHEWIWKELKKEDDLTELRQKRTTYLGMLDDDSVSLRLDGIGDGLCRKYDAWIKEGIAKGAVPQLMTTLYFAPMDALAGDQLAFILDMCYRDAIARLLSHGIYMPEPNLFLSLEDEIYNLISYLAQNNSTTLAEEGRQMVDRIRSVLVDARVKVSAERFLQTTLAKRMQVDTKERELTLKHIGDEERFKMYRNVSQTHLDHNIRGTNIYHWLQEDLTQYVEFKALLEKIAQSVSLRTFSKVILSAGKRQFEKAMKHYDLFLRLVTQEKADAADLDELAKVIGNSKVDLGTAEEEKKRFAVSDKEELKKCRKQLRGKISKFEKAREHAEAVKKELKQQKKTCEKVLSGNLPSSANSSSPQKSSVNNAKNSPQKLEKIWQQALGAKEKAKSKLKRISERAKAAREKEQKKVESNEKTCKQVEDDVKDTSLAISKDIKKIKSKIQKGNEICEESKKLVLKIEKVVKGNSKCKQKETKDKKLNVEYPLDTAKKCIEELDQKTSAMEEVKKLAEATLDMVSADSTNSEEYLKIRVRTQIQSLRVQILNAQQKLRELKVGKEEKKIPNKKIQKIVQAAIHAEYAVYCVLKSHLEAKDAQSSIWIEDPILGRFPIPRVTKLLPAWVPPTPPPADASKEDPKKKAEEPCGLANPPARNYCWMNASIQAWRSVRSLVSRPNELDSKGKDNRLSALDKLLSRMNEGNEENIKSAQQALYYEFVVEKERGAQQDPDETFNQQMCAVLTDDYCRRVTLIPTVGKEKFDYSGALASDLHGNAPQVVIVGTRAAQQVKRGTDPAEIAMVRKAMKEAGESEEARQKAIDENAEAPEYMQNAIPIEIEDSINIKDKAGKELAYALRACVIHLGNGTIGNESRGHYVAIARGADNQWRLFNDSHVTILVGDEWKKRAAESTIQYWERRS